MIGTDFKYAVTLDCSRISTLDYTSLKGIEALIKDLKNQNQSLSIINLDEQLENKLMWQNYLKINKKMNEEITKIYKVAIREWNCRKLYH